MFRDRLDQLSNETVTGLSRLLEVHQLASTPVTAREALGLTGMAVLDREFVDIRGGEGTFDSLRNIHDASLPKEAVNLRTFNRMLADAGFDPGITLPFTDTGKPQVLTAEFRDLTYSEGPDQGGDVLLWNSQNGVHWGPSVLGEQTLNSDYLFGDIHLVLYPFEVNFPDVPAGYIRFNDVVALNAFCATKVFFGNVNVWFKQDIGGTISLPNIMPPFSARLIQGNSVSFNDTLTVTNTRVRLDCGTFDIPVPFNSPKFEFVDCVFDSRSFYAVRERGTSNGNYLRATRCRGRITVFGYPSVSVGAEEIQITDSDLVLNIGSPHDNDFRQQRYRRVTATNSDVLVANNVVFPGNYVDLSHQLQLTLTNTAFAVRTHTPNTRASYWVPEAEHNFVYNYQRLPMLVTAVGSDVMLAHLELNKPSWASNADGTLVKPQSSPLLMATASRVHVVDMGDRSTQDLPGQPSYAPPLSAGSSVIANGTKGSYIQVGADYPMFGSTTSNGLYVDRPALAAAYGALGYLPVTVDASSRGVLVDRGAAAYSPTEAGVISVPSGVTEVRLSLTGAPV